MQNYIVNKNNNIINLLPTYKQIRFATLFCFFFFSIALTMTQFTNIKDRLVMLMIIFSATAVLYYLGPDLKTSENFTNMPNPGINNIDNSFDKVFLSYHIKTSYDPHIQKLPQ